MKLDNQQAILTYIVGLFEGEGSVALSKINATSRQGKKMPQIRSNVYFTNTDGNLIKEFIDFFKENNLSYYIRPDIRKTRRVCYSIQLTKQSDRLIFLEMILNHLKGDKKKEAEIVIEFLKHRIELSKTWKLERGGDGRYRTGCGTSYTDKDINLYEKYREVRRASETKCKKPVQFN